MATVSPNHPIHPSFHERISVRVEGQLPDFVKQDHATFVAFLEAYYEYMEQTGKPYEIIGNFKNYFNIDKTVDSFLQYFKKQFGKDVPEAIFANANKPQTLKHLRDFYRSKGSEKSFQFLFRLLYKEEIEFYYPSTDMLRVSDGRYTKDKILRCIDTSGTSAIFDLSGKTITGGTSTATGVVELVLKEMIGTFEVTTIYLSKVVGTFQRAETITDGTNTYTLDGMVTDYNITNAGNGYVSSTNVPISGGGAGAAGAQFLIDTLTTGNVTTATIVSGGTGYTVGDKLTINNTDKLEIDGRTCSVLVKTVNSGVITAVELEHNGSGYKAVPTITGGGTGTGANITLSGVGIGGVKTLKLINGGFHYRIAPTLDFSGIGDGTATGTAIISGYEDEANTRWIGDDGFISAANYIQDSKYYQAFSYEIKSGNTIDKWREYVKRLIHPSGLALWGRTLITGLLDTTLKVKPGEGDFRAPYVHYWPYKVIFHDGDIVPAVVLNNTLYQNLPEWPTGGAWPHDGQANGPGLGPGHSDWHIYELDLPIIVLTSAEFDDWLYVQQAMITNDDYGLITDLGISYSADWGYVTGGLAGSLVLGPMRRQVEQQKFGREGGYSKSSYKAGGSGYTSGTISVALSGGGGTGAVLAPIIGSNLSAEAPYTITDAVIGFTVTAGGSGYTSPPTITITDSGSGTGALAKAITAGSVGNGQPVTGGYIHQVSHASKTRYGTTVYPTIREDLGGGYTINDFKDEEISLYALNYNEKQRRTMNSDITLV